MKKIIISLFFLLLVLGLGAFNNKIVMAVESQWYWISVPEDPLKGYFVEEIEETQNTIGFNKVETEVLKSSATRTVVPDSFMEVMDETEDSPRCSGELEDALSKLRAFDASHEILIPFDCGPYGMYCKGDYRRNTANLKTIESREVLLDRIENDAHQCLDREHREVIAKELKENTKQRLQDVQKAIEKCDYEFFDAEMTSRERMQTYKQRMACEESQVLPVSEINEDTKDVVMMPEEKKRADLLNQIQVLMQLITKLQAQLLAQQNGLRS